MVHTKWNGSLEANLDSIGFDKLYHTFKSKSKEFESDLLEYISLIEIAKSKDGKTSTKNVYDKHMETMYNSICYLSRNVSPVKKVVYCKCDNW